jgi:hypothetical protein
MSVYMFSSCTLIGRVVVSHEKAETPQLFYIGLWTATEMLWWSGYLGIARAQTEGKRRSSRWLVLVAHREMVLVGPSCRIYPVKIRHKYCSNVRLCVDCKIQGWAYVFWMISRSQHNIFAPVHTHTRTHTHTHKQTHRPTTVLVDILSISIFVLQILFCSIFVLFFCVPGNIWLWNFM